MQAWPQKAIGDLCELINGRAFKPSDWGKAGLPIVRIQNLNDHHKPFNQYDGPYRDIHLIDDGAILLSWSGTPGTSFGCFRWTRGPALLNQHIFKVKVDESTIDGDFFIFAVNNILDEMIRQAHGGVGLRHITKGKLEAILLPVPHIAEQRRIVARIKECLERVEEIDTLRQESHSEADQLAASFFSALESAGKWPLVSVGELVVKSRNGRSIAKQNQNATGYVLSISSVHDVTLDLSQRKPIVLSDEVAKQFAISEGDVFVSRSNTKDLVGLASVAMKAPKDRIIYPDLLIKLQVDSNKILPRFLAQSLRTPESRRQIRDRAVGTSQSMVKISGERLKEVKLPLPPLKIQSVLIAEYDSIDSSIRELATDLQSIPISELRQSILRKAFAGEL